MDNVLKASVLASGSKGNCTFISTNKTSILIDAGMTCLYIEKQLNSLNCLPSKIDGIIITHAHSDHIQGLKVFVKKNKTKVYLTEKMYEEISSKVELINYEIIEEEFTINDITFDILKLSHDSNDSNGYIIKTETEEIAYVTDTGYINRKYLKKLKNKKGYIFESNHDIELLMNGKYPYYLKQRILGDEGHLSNKDSALYLSKLIGNNTQYVILIHLSDENNTRELAFETLNNKLIEEEINFDNIYISEQRNRTELM